MSTQSESPIQTAQPADAAVGTGDRTGLPRWLTGRRALWSIGLLAGVGLLAAIIAVLVFMEGGSSAAVSQIAVVDIINTVETDRPRGTGAVPEQFLPAVIGQELLPGDGIRTHVNSEARVDIEVLGHTRVSRTKPNSLWRLGRFSLEEGTVIELDEGRIFIFDDAVDPNGRPFKIVTPAGTASPRGTWLSVSYDPVTKVAELQCFRGTCQLENEFGSHVMGAEQKSSATPLAAPEVPVDMTPQETQEFKDLPEVVAGEVIIPTPVPTLEPTPQPTPEPTLESTPVVPNPSPEIENSFGNTGAGNTGAGNTGAGNTGANETGRSGSLLEPGQPTDPNPDAEAAAILQPTPEPTPVAAPTAMPRPTPEPTVQKTLEPTPTATLLPTPTPKPMDILLPPVSANTIPHVFVGSATIDSAEAPDGTEVSVWISGYSEPLATASVSAGSFTLLVPQFGTVSFSGRQLLFRLDGIEARPAAVWSPGGADVLSLQADRD